MVPPHHASLTREERFSPIGAALQLPDGQSDQWVTAERDEHLLQHQRAAMPDLISHARSLSSTKHAGFNLAP